VVSLPTASDIIFTLRFPRHAAGIDYDHMNSSSYAFVAYDKPSCGNGAKRTIMPHMSMLSPGK
jgi:hypothetical protein